MRNVKFYTLKFVKLDLRWSNAIKVLSTVLITGAIALEVWNLYTHGLAQFDRFKFLIGFERFALLAHLGEGAIAAIYASRKGEKPIRFAIYTFFVGTIGLLELFDRSSDANECIG